METVGIYTARRFHDGLRCIRCDYLFHIDGEQYYERPAGHTSDGAVIVELVCEACKEAN